MTLLLLIAFVVPVATAQEHTNKGLHYLEILDFYGAQTEFDHALSLAPDSEVAMVNLSLAHYYQGQFSEARNLLKDALKKAPQDPHVLFVSGIVEKVSEKPEEASKMFLQVAEIDPNEFSPFYQLGLIEFRAGRVDSAVLYFEKALTLNPDCTAATYNLGRSLIQCGRTEDGKEKLTEFQELRKRVKKPVRGGMGEPAILQGKYAQARPLP